MKKITLSICIATLNRAAFLNETLHSIVSQASEQVEIVIVDGASTDDTGNVVKRHQEGFPRLRYYRLDVKGGLDQDYDRAVGLAAGDYCWLFSDDDVMKPGALQAVLDNVDKGHDLIVVNAEVRNADLSAVIESRLLKLNSNRIYSQAEGEQFFGDTANYLSFIGAVVIRRELWLAREKEEYFGTFFVHIGVIFQSALPGSSLVIAEPLISIRYGNATWSARSFEIWMFKFPRIIWSFPHYSDASKRRVYPKEPWKKWERLLRYRASGHYRLKEYNNLVKPMTRSPLHRLLALTIARTPGVAVNLFVVIAAAFYGKNILMIDLKDSPFYFTRKLRKRSTFGR